MKLYEIAEAYKSLADAMEGETEIPEINEYLAQIGDEFDSKVDNLIKVIKNNEADIKAFKEQEELFAKKRKQKEQNNDRLKNYLYGQMKDIGKNKVDTGLFTARIQKNPASVRIVDPSRLPDKYKEEVVEVKIDKRAIKNDFKELGEVEGAELVQTEGIRIR